MKKLVALLLLTATVALGCKKDSKEEPDPLVGTWRSEKIEVGFYYKDDLALAHAEEIISSSSDYIEFVFRADGGVTARMVDAGGPDDIVTGTFTNSGSAITLRQQDGYTVTYPYTLNGRSLRMEVTDFPFDEFDTEELIDVIADLLDVDSNDLAFKAALTLRKQ